ncbi:MAG: PIN domain-containing protein [Wenzhouxiangella sp.]
MSARDIVLSPVVIGELQVGVETSRMKAASRAALDVLITSFACANIDLEAARCYGRIRGLLESEGQPIGGNDYWIAAQAVALELVLVTDNTREFQRIEGLRLENWLRADQVPR